MRWRFVTRRCEEVHTNAAPALRDPHHSDERQFTRLMDGLVALHHGQAR